MTQQEGSYNCPFRPHPTFVEATLPELAGWRRHYARLSMLRVMLYINRADATGGLTRCRNLASLQIRLTV
jgi:hypothetical protein